MKIKNLKIFILLSLCFCVFLCCAKRIDTNEVGVIVNNIYMPTKLLPYPRNWVRGVRQDIIDSGQIKYYIPIAQSIYKFDTSVRTIDLGELVSVDSNIEFKGLKIRLANGNIVYLKVVTRYKFNQERLPNLLVNISDPSQIDIFAIPIIESLIRIKLGSVTSFDLAIPQKREILMKELIDELNLRIINFGIVIQKINLSRPFYQKDYEAKINEKEKYKEEGRSLLAKHEMTKREMEAKIAEAKEEKERLILKAKAYYDQTIASSDSIFYEKQIEAEITKIKYKYLAEGIGKVNNALATKGGSNLIIYELAKNLQGKKILLLPHGSKESINFLDLGNFLKEHMEKDKKTEEKIEEKKETK